MISRAGVMWFVAALAIASTGGAQADHDSRDLCAIVSGQVGVSDLDFTLTQKRKRGSAAEVFATLGPSGRRALIDGVATRIALARAACESGVARSDAVRAEIVAVVEETLAENYVKRALGKLSDADVAEYYETHADKFRKPVEVLVRHIVVPGKDDAREQRARVIKGGDMGAIAAEVNTDASRSTQGLLGWIRPGIMEQPFEDVAFSQRVGEVSDPVRTNLGWNIIRVEGRRGGERLEFAKVKDQVSAALRGETLAALEGNARARFAVTVPDEAEDWARNPKGSRARGGSGPVP